jgi:hypothetical protein
MARTIEQACEDAVDHENLLASCNGFVYAVVNEFAPGAIEPGADADKIVSSKLLKSGGRWIAIGQNSNDATARAEEGDLVLGGLTSQEMTYTDGKKREHKATMGHVVVVVAGGPSKPITIMLMDGKTPQACRGGYPYCYQGAAHSLWRFKGKTQVDAVFPGQLLSKVHYAYIKLAARTK